jgi:UDP-glucose 4-epimerase
VRRWGAAAVVVLDDLSRRGATSVPNLPLDISFLRGDICDTDILTKSMRGVDVVYHLAAVSSVGSAQSDFGNAYRVNVLGTEAVLRAARESGVRRVVFTSSREVYGEPAGLPVPETAQLNPRSAYGLTKAAGESCCRIAGGLEVVVLRLANVYGPGDHGRVIPVFFQNAFRGDRLVLYGGEQIVDFIWIDDVVDALITAGGSVPIGGPLNVGTGVGVSLVELARQVVDLTKSSSIVEFLPKKPYEVTQFVADPRAAQGSLNLRTASAPLARLGELAVWMKAQVLDGKPVTV